jgi:hypothetical protein
MKETKFSIGDLFVFNTSYSKDIGVVTKVTKKQITICWESTNNQIFSISSIIDYLEKRKFYTHYPVVK